MACDRRVFIFSANYLPNIGGIERFTQGLSLALAKRGVHVTIVTNNTFKLASRETLAHNVDIVRLPCHPLIGGRMPIPTLGSKARTIFESLLSEPCDGVLINARFYIHSLIGLHFARKKGLTPVVLDHGSAYLTFGNPVLDVIVRVYEHCFTELVKLQHPKFYGISEKSVEWLKTFGISGDGVISNSIDAASFRKLASGRRFRNELAISDDRLMVAFTGRLIPEKGIDALLEMMRRLSGMPVDLVIAGDGPLRSRVESEQNEHLHLVGRLNQVDIAALLLDSDILCLPTRSEGFSTSLLEAAACGTPFIVSDVGGARELAPDDTFGFVVDSADPVVFAGILKRILRESIDLEEMGERCRLRVEHVCSWDSVALKVLEAVSS